MSGSAQLGLLRDEIRLTEKQTRLVEFMSKGVPIGDAWRLCEYANESSARATLMSQNVRLALDHAIRQRLASGTGAALSFLEMAFRGQIAGLPGGARVTAAIAWLDRAGYPVPRGEAIGKDSSDKALSEMSLPELRAAVATLKADMANSGPEPSASLADMLS